MAEGQVVTLDFSSPAAVEFAHENRWQYPATFQVILPSDIKHINASSYPRTPAGTKAYLTAWAANNEIRKRKIAALGIEEDILGLFHFVGPPVFEVQTLRVTPATPRLSGRSTTVLQTPGLETIGDDKSLKETPYATHGPLLAPMNNKFHTPQSGTSRIKDGVVTCFRCGERHHLDSTEPFCRCGTIVKNGARSCSGCALMLPTQSPRQLPDTPTNITGPIFAEDGEMYCRHCMELHDYRCDDKYCRCGVVHRIANNYKFINCQGCGYVYQRSDKEPVKEGGGGRAWLFSLVKNNAKRPASGSRVPAGVGDNKPTGASEPSFQNGDNSKSTRSALQVSGIAEKSKVIPSSALGSSTIGSLTSNSDLTAPTSSEEGAVALSSNFSLTIDSTSGTGPNSFAEADRVPIIGRTRADKEINSNSILSTTTVEQSLVRYDNSISPKSVLMMRRNIDDQKSGRKFSDVLRKGIDTKDIKLDILSISEVKPALKSAAANVGTNLAHRRHSVASSNNGGYSVVTDGDSCAVMSDEEIISESNPEFADAARQLAKIRRAAHQAEPRRPSEKGPFRPSRMVIEEECGLVRQPSSASEPGAKYLGDKTSKSYLYQDESLSDKENCCLWLTYLPTDVTEAEILASVHHGKVFCVHINPATEGHTHAAAKLAFMHPEAAARYYEQGLSKLGIWIRGHRIKAVYNVHGYRRYEHPERSRVLRIRGPQQFIIRGFLEQYFDKCTKYQLGHVRTLKPPAPGIGLIEYGFARVDGQAETLFHAIKREPSFQHLITVGYAPDPCDCWPYPI